jgi:predicted nucleic acid-binding protein
VILYLDTSSLVKLYVDEPGSTEVWNLLATASTVATSMVTYAETRAALARRHREGALPGTPFRAAKRAFEADWPHYVAVEVSADVCRRAGDIAERSGLRAYDSVQLACFATLAEEAPGAVVFSSFDRRLNDAADRLTRSLTRKRARARR